MPKTTKAVTKTPTNKLAKAAAKPAAASNATPTPATSKATTKAPTPPPSRLTYRLAVASPDPEALGGDHAKAIVEALQAAPKHVATVADIAKAAKLTPRAARVVLRALRSTSPAIVKVEAK